MEFRHAFNVTGYEGTLPEDEVHGFRSAVEELARDFKQLASMLLTVIILDLLYFILSLLLIKYILKYILLHFTFSRACIPSHYEFNILRDSLYYFIFPWKYPLLHRYLSYFFTLEEDLFHALDLCTEVYCNFQQDFIRLAIIKSNLYRRTNKH